MCEASGPSDVASFSDVWMEEGKGAFVMDAMTELTAMRVYEGRPSMKTTAVLEDPR